MNNLFPKFIQNRPKGFDKFDGASQTKLAKAIARQIIKNDVLPKEDALPKIIGIQGEWGAGKTNLVRLLEKELSDKYYFFEYDAWGHQEDLQRRSILELLTAKLIDDRFLSGNSTIRIKGGGEKTVSWAEKLKYLLARKTEKVTEKYPQISNGMAATALVAILTPIFTYISYVIKPTSTNWLQTIVSIIISALPVIIGLIVWLCAYLRNHRYGLSYLLAIYNDKIENDVCYETLSEDEPTVIEFKAWMMDISNYIKNNNKPKLILVFDNMDRLPAEKVKELWSSIHTFFADDGFENIWAIIPFDKKHLACAFGNEKADEAKELTQLFISKTFPVIYRVAPPVITDYRNLFEKLFIEAFGNAEEDSRETINRLCRMVRPDANVRDIIMYINAIVALKQERANDISLINMAVFLLFQDDILEHPNTQILSGEYLKNVSSIVNNDMQMQKEIAALVYGVDVELARQIPLTKYIEKCISETEGYDINEYAESNISFDAVLEDVAINRDDIPVDNLINCIGKLNKNNANIQKIWNSIALRKVQLPIEKQMLTNEYKVILSKVKDQLTLKRIVEAFYLKIYDFSEFKGNAYFASLKELEKYLIEENISCQLTQVKDKNVNPEIFIDYLREAKDEYKKYRVHTVATSFDAYLSEKLNTGDYSYSDVIALLDGDTNYKFPKLINAIELYIEEDKVEASSIGEIFLTYKKLSDKKPLQKSLTSQTVSSIMQQIEPTQKGYIDIVAMRLAQGQPVSSVNTSCIPEIAGVIDYYADYGELLQKSLNWDNSLLNDVLKYMTQNRKGEHLLIEDILPLYFQIKDRIGVSDKEMLDQLSDWSNNVDGNITNDNIQKIIPNASFYKLSIQYKNELTEKLNKIVIEAINTVSTEELYAKRNSRTTYYWFIAIREFVGTEYMHPLPTNISDFGKKILQDIGNNVQTLPLPEDYSKIINSIDKCTTYSIISDIRNSYCNGRVSIDREKFKFFEQWFRTQGKLEDRAGDSVDKILKPIISSEDCRNIILEQKEFYISLINHAGNAANDFKQTLHNIVDNTKDITLRQFAEAIGVVFESGDTENNE